MGSHPGVLQAQAVLRRQQQTPPAGDMSRSEVRAALALPQWCFSPLPVKILRQLYSITQAPPPFCSFVLLFDR